MTFVELAEAVAAETGIPVTKTATALSAAFRIIGHEVLSGRRVMISRFGAFFPVKLKPKTLFGGTKETRPRAVIRFKESKERRHGEAGRRVRR